MFQDKFPERQFPKDMTHYENSCIFIASNILKHIIFRGQTRSYKQWAIWNLHVRAVETIFQKGRSGLAK